MNSSNKYTGRMGWLVALLMAGAGCYSGGNADGTNQVAQGDNGGSTVYIRRAGWATSTSIAPTDGTMGKATDYVSCAADQVACTGTVQGNAIILSDGCSGLDDAKPSELVITSTNDCGGKPGYQLVDSPHYAADNGKGEELTKPAIPEAFNPASPKNNNGKAVIVQVDSQTPGRAVCLPTGTGLTGDITATGDQRTFVELASAGCGDQNAQPDNSHPDAGSVPYTGSDAGTTTTTTTGTDAGSNNTGGTADQAGACLLCIGPVHLLAFNW